MTKKFALAAMAALFVAGLCLAAGQESFQSARPSMSKKSLDTDNTVFSVTRLNRDGAKTWQTLLNENFETGVWPASWVVVDGNSDGFIWSIGTAMPTGSNPPNSGTYFALYNDDAAGSGSPATVEIMYAPAVPVAMGTSAYVRYDFAMQDYAGSGDLNTYVRTFSTGVWGSWTLLINHTVDEVGSDSLDLTAYLPADSLQIRFDFDDGADWGWGAGVDNVVIGIDISSPNDLAMQSIDEPSQAFIEPGLPFTPTATVYNPGTTSVSNFQVIFSISDQAKALVYEDTVDVAGPLDPGATYQATFNDFTPQPFTEYDITAYVSASGDPYAANDTLHYFFRTWDLDVGTAAVLAPTGNINPGVSLDPQATFHNYGQEPADFDAYFEIYEGSTLIYGESVNIIGLASGADTTVTFPNWAAPHNLGAYTSQAYTTMPYDLDPSNDTLAVGFNVSNAIWYQYAGTGPACASQNFEATYDNYDCWIADDFSVSGVDSALVDSISTGGGYWNGTGPADSLFFAICTDSSGMPSFTQIIWQANITAFSDNAGDMEVALPNPCMLQPGNYWLIHQAYMDYAIGGQYGWENRTPEAPIGSQGYWLNPGGGFGIGTGWVTASTAGWGNVDFQFALWGESFITGVAGGPNSVTKASFALMPNYPNPVTGRTTLSFSLPKAQAYSLKVFNIAGQMVKSFEGQGRAGANSVSWDASRSGAGVYFYQLASGGMSATRKLVIVK